MTSYIWLYGSLESVSDLQPNSGVKHALYLGNRRIVVYLTFLEIYCMSTIAQRE
ncbi:MAG: hypothetical protein V7K56_07215 [Nostoc sp.]